MDRDNLNWYNPLHVLYMILYAYVDWERMWYEPKNNFKQGDKVKLNWRYWAHLADENDMSKRFIFDEIDMDGVVDTKCGETYSLYWLTKANIL